MVNDRMKWIEEATIEKLEQEILELRSAYAYICDDYAQIVQEMTYIHSVLDRSLKHTDDNYRPLAKLRKRII